jgi:hypothetical protein
MEGPTPLPYDACHLLHWAIVPQPLICSFMKVRGTAMTLV